MWCPWCRQLADGSQASGAAGPGILATVLCVSQNDFVRGEGGRGGSHFPFTYRSPFIFTKGWVDLKYIVTVTECCVIPGEGLTLPGVFWAGFTKKAFDPAPSRQQGSSQPIVIPSQSVPILDRFLNIGKVFLSSAVDVPLRWVHGCEPLPGLPPLADSHSWPSACSCRARGSPPPTELGKWLSPTRVSAASGLCPHPLGEEYPSWTVVTRTPCPSLHMPRLSSAALHPSPQCSRLFLHREVFKHKISQDDTVNTCVRASQTGESTVFNQTAVSVQSGPLQALG